jgi:hypothetical protein
MSHNIFDVPMPSSFDHLGGLIRILFEGSRIFVAGRTGARAGAHYAIETHFMAWAADGS